MRKFKIPSPPSSTTKSIRFPNDVIGEVEEAIQGTDCTFNPLWWRRCGWRWKIYGKKTESDTTRSDTTRCHHEKREIRQVRPLRQDL